MVPIGNRASLVFFFFCKESKMVIGHLDLEQVLRENPNCCSFHKLQLVVLDGNDYLFKEHIAENLTVIITGDLELNARFSNCLSNSLENMFRHICRLH